MAKANIDSKEAQHLKRGDVIVWSNELWLVEQQHVPAKTTTFQEAEKYREIEFIILRHQAEDKWARTRDARSMIFKKNATFTLNNAVRVQAGYRIGKFQNYDERTGQPQYE